MGPTPRWKPLRHHAIQAAMWRCSVRFVVCPAGRRSGKTEIWKRKAVARGCRPYMPGLKIAFGAPTRDQAKRIFWNDLKALIPRDWWADCSESMLELKTVNSTRFCVVGMDRPERIEGEPLDGIVLDEYGNMKEETWRHHVRPALATPGRRPGWAAFIGVPEGRNHYYKRWKYALAGNANWRGFTWFSKDIIDPDELREMQEDMDELTFRQECEGSFLTYTGLAYYAFDAARNCVTGIAGVYNPNAPLLFFFDFNVAPGVAMVAQEFNAPDLTRLVGGSIALQSKPITVVLGEVWIPRNSNTPAVCRKLIEQYGDHAGPVHCYGDATGGAKGTAKVKGSDWDLIRAELGQHYGQSRVFFRYRKANPRERVRINSMNGRLCNTLGRVGFLIDPDRAPNTVEDFEGTTLLEGGSGEIDKKADPERSHLTDGAGYYAEHDYPVASREMVGTRV